MVKDKAKSYYHLSLKEIPILIVIYVEALKKVLNSNFILKCSIAFYRTACLSLEELFFRDIQYRLNS